MCSSYTPLPKKYRPDKFDDLIGQNAIKSTLKQAITANRIAAAYLFCGPRGTGKTSSARILARSLNCLKSSMPTCNPCGECEICRNISSSASLDVIEIDAASNTGVENIRELIERSRFAPVQSRWKVYVIDECHMLSTAAFNALLKTLEEPPPSVVFILATTDPQRVLPTIISRCQRFDFQRINIKDLIEHLKIIASKENIIIEDEAIKLIAQKAQGGLRDAESMLDQLSLLEPPIKSSHVYHLIGAIPEKEILHIVSSLAEYNPLSLIESCRKLLYNGKDALAILQALAETLRDLILLSVAPERTDLLSISNELKSELETIKELVSIDQLLQWQSNLKGTENQIRHSLQPNLWLEVLLLSTLAPKTINQEDNLSNKKNLNNLNIMSDKNKSEINQNNHPAPEKKYLNDSSEIKVETIAKEKKLHQDSEIYLNEIWLKILENLELPSTRMLLSQQAKLIRLTNDKAVIQVASNWMGMIQSRIELLNQAILETLDSERVIILENNLDQPLMEDNPHSNNSSINNGMGSSVENNQKPKENNIHDQDPKSDIKRENKETKTGTTLLENSTIQSNQIDNDAKKIADFFNGEILDNE